jgi:geranylgeranyl reductase family protein
MERCDVVVVGGGPAGSSCARALHDAGLAVIVLDRAAFPRDKVCAGWITPQAIDDAGLDPIDYQRGRTLQPITGFRTGVIGFDEVVETGYDRPVSYGIRRCEFDDYLLQRSGADVRLRTPLSSLIRDGAGWIVNDSIRADMLVGAGGHFCPVARWLNPTVENPQPLVLAQETEFLLEPDEAASWPIAPGVPELYFRRDLCGYGWCFRKGQHLNIGFGLLGRTSLPKATAEFLMFIRGQRRIPETASPRWHGHAYLVAEAPCRRAFDEAVLLIGDAAGVANPESGEGIGPAIESGLLAASTIAAARGSYSSDRLEPYQRQLRTSCGPQGVRRWLAPVMTSSIAATLVPWLLRTRWFTRHLILDRWFLATEGSNLSANRRRALANP